MKAASNDYSPQFAMQLMNKDFRLILETAAGFQIPMPVTAAAFQINAIEAASNNEEDFSAVIRGMEKSRSVELNQPGVCAESERIETLEAHDG